ncbi:MAG: glycosyltransferase [Deltaproteobacteria bacterium]|nr:glycosyltransferase [Deltaproteobacteria bacterium]
MAGVKLSVVIPIFNEMQYLHEILRRVCTAPLAKQGADSRWDRVTSMELIAVDDCSRDGSREWLTELTKNFNDVFGGSSTVPTTFRLILQEKNGGKGAAVRRGISETTGDIVIVQDADLEYSPGDYPQLLAPILANKADCVFGSRYLGEEKRVLRFWHTMLNTFLTTMTNMLCNTTLTDMETCYKVMRGDLARSIQLVSDRFGMEPELAARLAKARVRIFEVGISYDARSWEEGKKIGPMDGAAALWHIVRFSLFGGNPFKKGLRQAAYGTQHTNEQFYCKPLRDVLASLPRKNYGRALEIGSGLGTVTRVLTQKARTVVATDVDAKSVKYLNDRFRYNPGFTAEQWDATTDPKGHETPKAIAEGGFDLIVAMNILEHLKDDSGCVERWSKLLSDEGILIVLVPYGQFLFSPVDRAVGHHRRYARSDVKRITERAGLETKQLRFANPLGIVGWFLNGKVLGRSELPEGQARLYSALKPLVRPLEKLAENFVGLSIIAIAQKPKSAARALERTEPTRKAA